MTDDVMIWKLSLSLMFLPHIDVFFDLLLYRPTATWNLFTSYNNKITYLCNDDVIFTSILACIIQLTMVKSMKALYYIHEVINIASDGEKEVHYNHSLCVCLVTDDR